MTIERTGPSRQEEAMKSELRARRIEMAKTAGILGLALGGGAAMNFGEGYVQLAGGAIFLGGLFYPVVDGAIDFVRDWRGNDIRAKYERGSE